MSRGRGRLTTAFKQEVAKEYLYGNSTMSELAFKYGISSGGISKWVNKYREELREEKISLSLPVESSTELEKEEDMARKATPEKSPEIEALESQVSILEKKLKWAEMKCEALNTLIDIAESQGIKIRKKSGVKQ